MRTKNSIFVLMLGVMFVMGCSTFRKGLVEMSNQDVKNAEASREAAKNFISTWKLNSGFIRGALGDRITEFPAQFIAALDELDTIADKETLVDYDLGYFLGLRVRSLETIVQETLKMYAPDIFDLIPFPLKY
uniref:Lipoprotein n=1 Tax=viral metagenome TaxID=1070528 RepID=A0A6H1ZCU9_9ZZZZ